MSLALQDAITRFGQAEKAFNKVIIKIRDESKPNSFEVVPNEYGGDKYDLVIKLNEGEHPSHSGQAPF